MYLEKSEYDKLVGMRGRLIIPKNFPKMGAFFIIDDPEGIALLNKKRGDKMKEVESMKRLLEIYGETDSPVLQEFYQGLCFAALGVIEILEKNLTECQLQIINTKGGPDE